MPTSILSLLLTVCISISVNAQATLSQHEAIALSRNELIALIDQEDIVGLAISVSYKDSLIWSEGFGYSDLDKTVPISPSETYFRIASLSKPITATIMGRLYEEEVVDLDESVYTYVPDFPKKKYDFTLTHLARHRAGIRHYKSSAKENTKPLSMVEGLDKFKKSKLKFKPGTDYLYSSYGYNLLGVALENASNLTFDKLLYKYITQPLQMNHTIADPASYSGMRISGFFESNGKGKVRASKPVNMVMKWPSGGLLSTSEDLVKFGSAYVNKEILTGNTQSKLLQIEPLPSGKRATYAMGWGVLNDKDGRTILSHSGGNTGAVCRLIIYPEQKITVAVVSNTFGIDWMNFMKVVNTIPRTLLKVEG